METATMLDDLCPPTDATDDDMEDYPWNVWNLMVQIAISPNSTDSMLEFLQGNTVSRHYRQGPSLQFTVENTGYGEIFPYLLWRWMLLAVIEEGAFPARCYGAGLGVVHLQSIVTFRYALEQEQTDGQAAAECRIKVTCEWITHAAPTVLRWAQENIGRQITEDDQDANIENGPLYNGPPAVCIQRWGFWQDRFEAIGNGELEIRQDIQEAAANPAESMKILEAKIAHTL